MSEYFAEMVAKLDFWAGIGIVGQLIFTTRFVVQWLVSEARKESTIPISFWWISIVGSLFVLAYGFQHKELPVILGQLLGFGVYIRNLVLIYGKRAATPNAAPTIEWSHRAGPPGGTAGSNDS